MKFIKKLYLNNRFFWGVTTIVTLFAVAYSANVMFFIAQIALAVFLAITLIDVFVLFRKRQAFTATRSTGAVYSLGEENDVELTVQNNGNLHAKIKLIDELPDQFQERDFQLSLKLKPFETKVLNYKIRPVIRGQYVFGNINIFSRSNLGLVSRRDIVTDQDKVAVFPSTVMMKKFELFAFRRFANEAGVRRLRRIGHSYEFDHIKNYVSGDDPRSINWKASGRRAELMVNHYMDEKAQQIYCLLDKSRVMQMPFDGLSLLDHAINTSLAISNIVLRKQDNAGLISFSNRIGNIIKAGTGTRQLHKIYNALYNEKENPLEANYELLYNAIRKLIGSRSLLLLFTNFESTYAMERVLPILRRINRFHLLVVIFFKNTRVSEMADETAGDIESIYNQTIARKYLSEKELVMQELQKHRIQVIYTSPDQLPVNTINKYLELKARGMI
jgi:uncharacterized protein (DUF58 family)